MHSTGSGPLLQTVTGTPTDIWNDSCATDELRWAIEHGATGATSNPAIVAEVMQKEWEVWAPRVREIAAEHPDWTDVEVTWRIIEEMAARGAAVLEPIFVRHAGRKGRLSIQTNPTFHSSTDRMLQQARGFDALAPNMQVKFPATSAGIAAMEQATFEGISINATVSFTLPQALAVGEAVERGLQRREADGLDVSRMAPVCTLMLGRLDDWIKAVCDRDDIVVDPAAPNWAGLAVFKRAAAIYRERGFRTRPLAAAYRNLQHWTELVGGDLVMTMTHQWQRRFEASGLVVRPRFDEPVPAASVAELLDRVPDFRQAYEPEGLTLPEIDDYGATLHTLRIFTASYWGLVKTIDDLLLPDPTIRRRPG